MGDEVRARHFCGAQRGQVPGVLLAVDALQAVVVPPVIVVAGALRERITQALGPRPVR